jgi:hypothetical protein
MKCCEHEPKLPVAIYCAGPSQVGFASSNYHFIRCTMGTEICAQNRNWASAERLAELLPVIEKVKRLEPSLIALWLQPVLV